MPKYCLDSESKQGRDMLRGGRTDRGSVGTLKEMTPDRVKWRKLSKKSLFIEDTRFNQREYVHL